MRKLWPTLAAALVVLVAGPLASASATGPAMTIASPVEGTPTSESTPAFSGTTQDSAAADTVTVEVLEDGTAIQTLSGAPEGESWKTGSAAPLANGTYTAIAKQFDTSTAELGSTSIAFTVERTPPRVTLNPLAELEGTSSPSFAGEAEAGDGSVTLSVYRGTAVSSSESPVGTAKASAGGGSWSTGLGKSLADGTYTAIAEQSDNAHNVGASAPSTFTIKTKGPAVSLGKVASPTRNTIPAFSGDAGTAFGDKSAVTVVIYSGTAETGSPVQRIPATSESGIWTAGAAEPLADGVYTAIAEQYDSLHNRGVSAASTFVIDTTAPTLSLSVPPNSSGLETVSGKAGNATGDAKQVTAELFQGPVAEAGQAIETITVNARDEAGGRPWSATFAGLGSGEYTVLARQSDEAGNTGTTAPQGFTVVAAEGLQPAAQPLPSPPVASFTWVPANPVVGQSVSLASNSTGGSSPLSGFSWDLGSGQFAGGGALLTTSFATPGTHVVRLQVTDANGLSSVTAHAIVVATQTLELMQPFPIVRIAGSETSSGARVKLLSVQAPATTKVAVSCKGSGCKIKAESRIAMASSKSRSRAGAITLAFPRFQRALRAGAVLQIRVSKPGEIGKFTSFTIRRNKLPVRVDACLLPSSSSPSPCPNQ
jgi:hypothetical protein